MLILLEFYAAHVYKCCMSYYSKKQDFKNLGVKQFSAS